MAKKAKITLVGPLSLSVGRYRFFKDRPVLSDDEELIRYCEFNPDFKVSVLDDGAAPKKAVPRSEVREKKAEEKKPEPKPVPKAPEPIEVPDALDSSAGEPEELKEEEESSSRLTRKKKRKGDDA